MKLGGYHGDESSGRLIFAVVVSDETALPGFVLGYQKTRLVGLNIVRHKCNSGSGRVVGQVQVGIGVLKKNGPHPRSLPVVRGGFPHDAILQRKALAAARSLVDG